MGTTISDAFIGRHKVIEMRMICYDFATPTKALALFVYFIPASRRCSAEMGDCENPWQPAANLCYSFGFPLFVDPSIFKTIEIPSYLKYKSVESAS